jgi:SAM-dependent methyltransferase
MAIKPAYLGPEFSASFGDASVVAAYAYRSPYPAEVFAILRELIVDEPRVVLDAGCGRGDIARALVTHVERVDAVDVSAAMIAAGKQLSGGDDPRLRWILSRVEDAPIEPPYALVAAGQSLHWMDWNVVLPRFADALTERGVLAIVSEETQPVPWGEGISPLIKGYSLNQAYRPFDMLAEWERSGLWIKHGERRTAPVPFRQSTEHYIESFHGRSSLSRDRMRPEDAAAFDADLRALVEPFAADGQIELQVIGSVVWGKPQNNRQ